MFTRHPRRRPAPRTAGPRRRVAACRAPATGRTAQHRPIRSGPEAAADLGQGRDHRGDRRVDLGLGQRPIGCAEPEPEREALLAPASGTPR